MDETSQYIKMCDHPLIQDSWVPSGGDWYWDGDCSQLVNWEDEKPDSALNAELEDYKYTWLPGQDQVQEMMGEFEVMKLFSFVYGAYPRACWLCPDKHVANPIHLFESWEQYWLAFYMSEKHQMLWDGEKWEDPPTGHK